MPQDSEFDAIVIGSGPNGLAAAVTLAQNGRSVLVLEANDTIGGGTRSAALTLPGFTHDVCSAIHPMGVASPFFQSLPLQQHGLEWIHPRVPLAHPFDEGPAAVLSHDVAATAKTFGDADDEQAYLDLVSPFVPAFDRLAHGILRPPSPLTRHPLLMARFGWYAVRSARSLADSLFQGERAAGLMAGLAGHALLPLDQRMSAAIGLTLAIAGHAVGWPMPRGGSQAIANSLASYLQSLGGQIRTGVRVTSMADLPPARAYLFDTSPRALAAIAQRELPGRYLGTLTRFKHGPGVFKIDYALAGPIPWRDPACRYAGTVHLGGSFNDIAPGEHAVWQGDHPRRPLVLLAQPTRFDLSRAPSGRHVAWAYCHVPHGSTFDMTERIEAQIERFAPGFRDLILPGGRRTWNTPELEASNPNLVGGDITGGANTLGQIIARPRLFRPYRTPNRKIYLCSASTPPGGGVHGMCGHLAALSALRRTLR